MGFVHHYGLIKEADDNKDEPQSITPPATTPWWKLLLFNVLAAVVGAGVMFLILHSSSAAKSSDSAVASMGDSATEPSAPPVELTSVTEEDVTGKVDISETTPGQVLDCGYSPAEARAKGCVYDVMMQDWVPEPCYDSVLTERYLAAGNWTWYADGEGKTTMSDEQMRKGEHGKAWMSSDYHKAHCVFSWLKIIRALRNNRGISQELLSYDHVLHCSHGALKQETDNEGLGVSAPTNYAKCALYNTWMKDLIPDKHDSAER